MRHSDLRELQTAADMAGLELEFLELLQDSKRYQWLRAQHWNDGRMAVVVNPKAAIKLGHDCPSLHRLDTAIDAELLKP